MSIKDLQATIKKEEGFILSDGTLNLTHLLPKVYDLITEYNLKTDIKKDIEQVFENTDKEETEKLLPTFTNQFYNYIHIPEDKEEDASYIFNEDVFNYLNNIAPQGYYFGSSEGDGACFGFFQITEEEDY